MPDATETAVRSSLDTLESFFATATQRIDTFRADYGRGASIAKLSTELQGQLSTLLGNADSAFANAIGERERALAEARTKHAASPDGARYLASLAGFAALAPTMKPEAFAAKVEAALNDGDHPSARAWLDLGGQYAPSPALAVLGYRVKSETVPAAEQQAQAQLDRMLSAQDRFRLFRHTAPRRLNDALSGSSASASFSGSFGSSYVFAESRTPNREYFLSGR